MSPISEDELRARLRSVEPSPARPGYAEHVVHQGRFRRRRQRWVTGISAAAAVAVIGAGAFVVSDRLGRDDALPAQPTPIPTATTPDVTPTVTSTTSPTESVTGTPSATTRPSVSTPPSALPSEKASHSPIIFLHQGVKGDGEVDADWLPTTQFNGPCDTDAWALAGRYGADDRRAIRGGGIDGGPRQEAVFAFPDTGSAVAFMGELRQVTRACESTSQGRLGGLVENLPGPWGEGLASTYFVYAQDESTGIRDGSTGGGPVILAVRAGRGIALSGSAGPFRETHEVDPDLIRSARPGVEHLYPQLCRYTEAGC
ncbi:hypothetical protein N802_17225 [Knoellia sinensis KCTC 19936]|uniref:PknH-like extracellular domain-containing protein n=1 Tax=Knoellia sinensis KCTC 19936 TaxID=1385520 RepID=A0A0A0J5R5_9MICO|nr:hypothetical protein [Knoellia sinensis]KGN32695.1 hypothetical protein N802_17225 [Knoellia sinensis KCTC 19936]